VGGVENHNCKDQNAAPCLSLKFRARSIGKSGRVTTASMTIPAGSKRGKRERKGDGAGGGREDNLPHLTRAGRGESQVGEEKVPYICRNTEKIVRLYRINAGTKLRNEIRGVGTQGRSFFKVRIKGGRGGPPRSAP